MSVVKGTLLAIVLAVAVFGVVFGIISVAMKTSAESVADRMTQSAEIEPDFSTQGQVAIYTLP